MATEVYLEPLVIVLPFIVDIRVGMNSGLGHRKKREISNSIHRDSGFLANNQIQFYPENYLRDFLAEKYWPLVVVCDRQFSGKKNKFLDEDNLASCLKYNIDGICESIGYTDDPQHLKMRYKQTRLEYDNRLVFTFRPLIEYEELELVRLLAEKAERERIYEETHKIRYSF